MESHSKTSHTGLRGRLSAAPQREQHFRWRGNEVSRVEGFTDAVFAFAVTLLVVALEVPHTFEGLLDVLRGFPAFVLSFALLMAFWNADYRFHRRIYVGVCLLSIALALFTNSTALPGFIYFLLGPLLAFNGWRFGTRARAMAPANP